MILGEPFPNIRAASQLGHKTLPQDLLQGWTVIHFDTAGPTAAVTKPLNRLFETGRSRGLCLNVLSVSPDPLDAVRRRSAGLGTSAATRLRHPWLEDTDGQIALQFFFDVLPWRSAYPRGLFVFDPAHHLAYKAVLPDGLAVSGEDLERVCTSLARTWRRKGHAAAPYVWTRPILDRTPPRARPTGRPEVQNMMGWRARAFSKDCALAG